MHVQLTPFLLLNGTEKKAYFGVLPLQNTRAIAAFSLITFAKMWLQASYSRVKVLNNGPDLNMRL